MRKNNPILILIGIGCLLLFGVYFYNNKRRVPIRHLPYYGKKSVAQGDTAYHKVPEFSFLNQNGNSITKNDLRGKIYVADYFFTTCQSICPIMKKQMNRVYKIFLNDPDVLLVSHTVDPVNDSVATLKKFSRDMGIDDRKWFFLTGEKRKLYDLARSGYFLDASAGNGGEDDFIHTQNFVLVDKSFHIRGYYNGTDSADVNRLIKEIEILKQEYAGNE